MLPRRTPTSDRPWARSALVALVLATVGALTSAIVTAPAATAAEPTYGGYLFAYFTGESTADGEQIYFAASRGNDPLAYDPLNGGRPVLTSTIGTKGVRDPFLLRKQDGTFVLIATDLRKYNGPSWDQVQRTGSRSIIIWESTNLVTWTAPRAVQVAGPTAGNVWAPEAFWDPATSRYVVFWASKLYAANDPNHTGNTYNKMLYATTTDFRTFSSPTIWVDPGYSVIDSTVIANGGTYYRFTKDERSASSGNPCSKFIIAQKSTSLTSTNYGFVADCIGRGTINQGEGPLIFKSNTANRWYLFIDEFGGRGYVPFESTDLNSGRWTEATGARLPAKPRHGTVLPITAAELQRVTGAAPAVQVTTGRRSLQATTPGYTTNFVKHSNFLGVTAPITASSAAADKQSATFVIRAGLADASCYSFESVNYPGRYLRHSGFEIRLDPQQSTTLYRQDATFCAQAGNSGGQGLSWRAFGYPTRYLRHYGQRLYVASNGGPNAFDSAGNWAADTTWLNSSPWAP